MPSIQIQAEEEQSLNGGDEFDEERQQLEAATAPEQLFEDVVPGEIPELKEVLRLLPALEAQLQDLMYLRQDMLRTHGMTRSFALEGQRILPGFDGGLAAGYYTEQPSATRYRVALEEVHKGVWALLAAAAAAVVAAIVKFISWFRQRNANPVSGAQDAAATAQENLKKLDKLEEGLQDLAHQVHSGAIASEGERITMDSLIESLWSTGDPRYQRILRFLQEPHPVFYDIIHRGPYTKAFREVSHSLAAVADILQLKVRELEKIAALDRNSFLSSDQSANTRALQVISQPVELRLGGSVKTLSEAVAVLSNARMQVLTEEHSQKLTVTQMTHAVVEAYRAADVVRFFQAQAEIVDVFNDLDVMLKKLQKTVGNLATDGTVGHNSEGMAQHLREVIFTVAQDITGYQRLFAEMRQYGVYLEHLADQTVGVVQEIEQQLFALAERGNVKLPEDWQQRVRARRASRIDALFKAAQPSGA